MELEGRVALVTGAGGDGMGRSIALTLAREGADIVVNYHRRRERAEQVAAVIESMGRRAFVYGADVSDAAAVQSMVEQAEEQLGPIDILVNSAGGLWQPADITAIDPEHWRSVLAEEVDAVFYAIRAVLPGMRKRGWGRIVSIGGYEAEHWRFAPPQAPLDYPLGKAGRHWLTRTLAPPEIGHGVTINAVAPGPIPHIALEEAVEAARAGAGRSQGQRPRQQDVAETVAFLCSERARFVTGAIITIRGAQEV
jgi:3-oxoacyl-[acyl-carrier protein] reductase